MPSFSAKKRPSGAGDAGWVGAERGQSGQVFWNASNRSSSFVFLLVSVGIEVRFKDVGPVLNF